MTEAVVWLVVWALFTFVGTGIVYLALLAVGVLIAALTNQEWFALVGVVIGWIAGAAWFIFAAVQTVLQIIAVVQLAVT